MKQDRKNTKNIKFDDIEIEKYKYHHIKALLL